MDSTITSPAPSTPKWNVDRPFLTGRFLQETKSTSGATEAKVFSLEILSPGVDKPIGCYHAAVQELIVIDDLLSALVGIEGRYTSIRRVHGKDDNVTFQVDASMDLALQESAKRIFPLCESYLVINQFVESMSQFKFGLVNHAFAAALRSLLLSQLLWRIFTPCNNNSKHLSRCTMEDSAANKRRQQELHVQLEALSLIIFAARTEAVRGKIKGRSTKKLCGGETTDGSALSLSIAAARPSAQANKDDDMYTKGMDDHQNRELHGSGSAYGSTYVPNPKNSKWDFPNHRGMSDPLGGPKPMPKIPFASTNTGKKATIIHEEMQVPPCVD